MDPISMTQAEAAMLESIKQNIVDPEVMQPMDAISWQHGAPPTPIPSPENPDNPVQREQIPQETHQPEPVKVDDPPTVTAEKTATPPATGIDWESLRDPKNGKILGKYENEVEATKGVRHAVEMAKSALAQKAEVEAEVMRLKAATQVQQMVQQPPREEAKSPRMIVEPKRLDEVLARIVDEGGTLDQQNIADLREALLETSQQISAKTVEDVLSERDSRTRQENERWTKVDNYMRSAYPESLNFTDEISVYIQTTPRVGKTVNALISSGNEVEAAEFAWLEYQRASEVQASAATAIEKQTKEITLSAADQVRREAVEQARKDAGVMTTIASGIHETPDTGPSRSEVEEAAHLMRMTGSAPGSPGGAKWRALTFGADLKGPLFD